MNVLEVAVYAMVIGGQPQPIKCVESDLGGVNCTNGLAAVPGEHEEIRFSNGVRVVKKTGIVFSNGVTAHLDGAGWLEFSNGIGVRRDSPFRFRFSNGFSCTLIERSMAECLAPERR
ncbi:MAG: hypothetical protein WCO00_03680 [Rhodospirillaceae bacterium]